MDAASLFKPSPNLVQIRLALQEWTELPARGSEEWAALSNLLQANALFKRCEVREIDHNGVDVYLLVRLDLSASIEAVVEELRHVLRDDPFWRPFIDLERYAWVGDYFAESVPWGKNLKFRPLEHPARQWKRQFVWGRERAAQSGPWHPTASPGELGVEFLDCTQSTYGPFRPEAVRLDLSFRKPVPGRDETWAALHLNTRLRLSPRGPMFESVGWNDWNGHSSLVFSIPVRHLAEIPKQVEVWWATDVRKQIGSVPCRSTAGEA